jgi:hypothetical protein
VGIPGNVEGRVVWSYISLVLGFNLRLGLRQYPLPWSGLEVMDINCLLLPIAQRVQYSLSRSIKTKRIYFIFILAINSEAFSCKETARLLHNHN